MGLNQKEKTAKIATDIHTANRKIRSLENDVYYEQEQRKEIQKTLGRKNVSFIMLGLYIFIFGCMTDIICQWQQIQFNPGWGLFQGLALFLGVVLIIIGTIK